MPAYLQNLLLLVACAFTTSASQPPNILLIVADDYGYNDIGYHGSELKTPTLDKLAAQGVKLENYYVQPICSPTRSQLLSGRYQIHTGLQHSVIMPCVPTGLPLQDKTLADKLKEKGYSTHMVGKWHIGFYKPEYTPMKRGFDSFYGYLQGGETYFKHYRSSNNFGGVDFHRGLNPYNGSYGEYSTTAFTRRAQSIIQNHNASQPLFLYLPYQSVHAPLQVPASYEKPFYYIKDSNRRTYAAMVAALDEGIRNITESLKSASLWDNTLIVFTTDNGGQVFSGGNNAPLRGNKGTYFEGGIKGVGFVSGPVVKSAGTINHQLIHVSDWFPTLINLVGGSLNGTKPDGYDMWQSIIYNKNSPRNEILYNIDPMTRCKNDSLSDVFDTSVLASLRYGDYKIITGDPGYDEWVPEPTSPQYNATELNLDSTIDTSNSECGQTVHLFNIVKDPEERHDLSQSEPDMVDMLLKRLAWWNSTAVPVNYPPQDKRCNPALHGGFWRPWE